MVPITTEELEFLLLLVLNEAEMPSFEEIDAWSIEQKEKAERWAALEVYYANDHKVERLPKPGFLVKAL